jgi:hypothetical protein
MQIQLGLRGSSRWSGWEAGARLLIAAAVLQLSPVPALADDMGDAEGIVVEAADEEVVESSSQRRFDAAQIGASALDIVLLRPLGVGASAVGLCFFIVTAPFVAPSMEFDQSWDIFVAGPGEYTFVRPIGTI